MNPARSRLGPAANRRSQPRTVAAARPTRVSDPAMPPPAAASPSAAPITSTTSARRTSTHTGNNTWVAPQPAHRARRGRDRHPTSPSPRSTRRPGMTPRQPADPHTRAHQPPATNRASTPTRPCLP